MRRSLIEGGRRGPGLTAMEGVSAGLIAFESLALGLEDGVFAKRGAWAVLVVLLMRDFEVPVAGIGPKTLKPEWCQLQNGPSTLPDSDLSPQIGIKRKLTYACSRY